MGDIYLKEKRDKKAYLRKYLDLVDRNPSIETYFLLGEAYLIIQEVGTVHSKTTFIAHVFACSPKRPSPSTSPRYRNTQTPHS
jgi:hypothetical protein